MSIWAAIAGGANQYLQQDAAKNEQKRWEDKENFLQKLRKEMAEIQNNFTQQGRQEEREFQHSRDMMSRELAERDQRTAFEREDAQIKRQETNAERRHREALNRQSAADARAERELGLRAAAMGYMPGEGGQFVPDPNAAQRPLKPSERRAEDNAHRQRLNDLKRNVDNLAKDDNAPAKQREMASAASRDIAYISGRTDLSYAEREAEIQAIYAKVFAGK